MKSQDRACCAHLSSSFKLWSVIIFSRKIILQLLVCASGVPAAEQDEVKRNGGESVSLDSGETRKPNDVMTWFFKDDLIAQITGDPNKTCTDVQCNETERFRDRLKLDNQTGSLNITDTRTTDSGLYTLQIIISDSRFSITREKRFSVTVTGEYTIQSFHEFSLRNNKK